MSDVAMRATQSMTAGEPLAWAVFGRSSEMDYELFDNERDALDAADDADGAYAVPLYRGDE